MSRTLKTPPGAAASSVEAKKQPTAPSSDPTARNAMGRKTSTLSLLEQARLLGWIEDKSMSSGAGSVIVGTRPAKR